MRILAFGAHPDDIEFCCAGTLAKYRQAGHEVGIVVTTNGEVGSPTLPKAEIATIRENEARASAAKIDAEFFWFGYPDEFLFNTPEVRLRIIEVTRRFRPDIMLAPDKDVDYHPDHICTGQAVWDTHVMSSVPNIQTESAPTRKIPKLFFMDTVAGVNFQPELYVDITRQWPVKEAMISCHTSQNAWLRDQYGVSCAEFGEKTSRFRGLQAGCRYAECFRAAKFFPNTVDAQGLL